MVYVIAAILVVILVILANAPSKKEVKFKGKPSALPMNTMLSLYKNRAYKKAYKEYEKRMRKEGHIF